jgi:hypothetical protein
VVLPRKRLPPVAAWCDDSSGYGFLNLSDLPKQSYSGKILSSATSDSKWGTTG